MTSYAQDFRGLNFKVATCKPSDGSLKREVLVAIILIAVLLQVSLSIENIAAAKAAIRSAKHSSHASSVVKQQANIRFAVLPLMRSTQIIYGFRKISGRLQQLWAINTSIIYYFYDSTWALQSMFESAKSVSLYDAFVSQLSHKYSWRLEVNSPKITDKILTNSLVPQLDSFIDIDVDWNKTYLPESDESPAYKKFSIVSTLSLLLSTNYPLRTIYEVINRTWPFLLSTYLEMTLIRTVGKVPLSSPLKTERVLSPNVALLSFISTGQVGRCPVIVLDPGHGGTDPGAIGVSGVFEKHLTLAMAIELRERLLATGRYSVALTRENDVFIALHERVASARAHGADLFISLHADAITTSKTRGLSAYTLSETASDHEAAALADRENKADLIGGVNLSNKSSDVANILIDLVQRETMNHSAQLASVFIRELQGEVYLLPKAHRFAGFAVLKAPDVPAVLLEIGYLSNPEEEQLLHQSTYRAKLSSALVRAIDHYFKRHKLI